jgi:hypothetical protein
MHVTVSRSFAAVVAVLLFAAQAARADEAADLIAKNLATRGGAEKLAAIASIEFTGRLVEPGDFELSYRETRARKNDAARVDATVQGLTLVQAYDGSVGWRVNPFEGRRDAARMSADDMRAFADDETIDGPLLAAKARGSTVTYLGREDFEGTETYKVRVTQADGAEYVYYLDPDTYLEIKVIETRKLRGAPQITLMEYGDYELVNGVYFPFEIEAGSIDSTSADRSRIQIKSAKANVPASGTLFAFPATPVSK